ncbi:hypothetical protein [Pandoraea iniqua]|uniref:hypothetical protein n=1 Tax=Pandoraea iniqua TaxID=2508288 RepID=UPI0012420043|nr:hypothetical protein [Pandoraea iniqua]
MDGIGDIVGFLNQAMHTPGALNALGSAATGGFSAALNKFRDQKSRETQRILAEEIRVGKISPERAGKGDMVFNAIFIFERAALEGSARINLRLLASALNGQLQQSPTKADEEFLAIAKQIADLRESEIHLLASIVRHGLFHRPEGVFSELDLLNGAGTADIGMTPFGMASTLVRVDYGATEDEFEAAMTALQRTGFVSFRVVGGGLDSPGEGVQAGTPRLRQLVKLADIDAAIAREAASTEVTTATPTQS